VSDLALTLLTIRTEQIMEVTVFTIIVGIVGLFIMGLLATLQFIAVLKPRSEWVIKNVYGGEPSITDPKAFFAYNQGWAWSDSLFWGPIQLAGSVGMLLGHRWGFLMALIGSVPFWYSAISLFIWDRDLGIRKPTLYYWVIIWGMFPAFGVLEMVYCFIRLLA
jgi:hypothetical protein